MLYILLISKFLEIIMKNVVVADFKVKSDKVQEMAEVFKEALVVTRDFDGCLASTSIMKIRLRLTH